SDVCSSDLIHTTIVGYCNICSTRMDKMTCTTKICFQTCRIVFFNDIHRYGRHKLSVWKYVHAITVTLNTRKSLYIAIPWSDIVLADWQICTVPITNNCLKIENRKTITLTTPSQ